MLGVYTKHMLKWNCLQVRTYFKTLLPETNGQFKYIDLKYSKRVSAEVVQKPWYLKNQFSNHDFVLYEAHRRTITTSLWRLKKNNEGITSFDSHEEETEESPFDTEDYRKHFHDSYLLPHEGHRVFVIQPVLKNKKVRKQGLTTSQHQLDEACALVESLPKWKVDGKLIQNVPSLGKKELFGTGTFESLKKAIRGDQHITAVFINLQMLSGLQLSSLQRAWRLPVYDRFTLVLQIFKTRAQTKESKLQVALAELPYFRSRLKGLHMGTLDQQGGGMSSIGGSGETYINTRRRLLHEREVKLKRAIEKLKDRRELLRKERLKKQFPIVAVVGYTNAGKTSLIKALTQDQTMEPMDKLFATLDVTVHAGILSNRMKCLFVDTVGFISDIPTELIASFAATLEDAMQADVILHVRDISHPDTAAQKTNVIETLQRLNIPQKLKDSTIEVCNKIDLMDESSLNQEVVENSVPISATSGYGIQQLIEQTQEAVIKSTGRVQKCMKIPTSGPHLNWLYKEGTVEAVRACEDDTECLLVDVVMTGSAYAKFVAHFGKKKKIKS